MTEKIIHLPTRSALRAGGARAPLSQQLRERARVPVEDRPVMAANLGRMAASIDKADPLLESCEIHL